MTVHQPLEVIASAVRNELMKTPIVGTSQMRSRAPSVK